MPYSYSISSPGNQVNVYCTSYTFQRPKNLAQGGKVEKKMKNMRETGSVSVTQNRIKLYKHYLPNFRFASFQNIVL